MALRGNSLIGGGGGGGGTPGGSSGQVQFNNGGSFGGIAGSDVSGQNLRIGGSVTSRVDSIGATPTDGVVLENTTAATLGNQQWSPAFRLRGQGHKSATTAGSQPVDFRGYLQPIQGVAAPTSRLVLQQSINNGAYGTFVSIDFPSNTWSFQGNAILQNISSLTASTGNITTVNAQNLRSSNFLDASAATGVFIRNSSGVEVARFGVFNSNWSFSANADVIFNKLSANAIPLLDGSKALTSNVNFNFDQTNFRHGIGIVSASTAAMLDVNAVFGEGVGAPTGLTLTLNIATTLPDPSGIYSVAQVTTFSQPDSPSATQDFGGTGYNDDSNTWDFEYYAYDSAGRTCQYTAPTAQVVEGGSAAPYSINHSWSAPTIGDFSPSGYAIRRVTDDQWVNVGNALSFADSNDSWGASPLSGTRNDLIATGATQDYDAYAKGISPSGADYYSTGFETVGFSDDNSGNYYVRRHASSGGTLKFSNGTNSGVTPYDEGASGLSGDLTFTPNSYGFGPNSDNFNVAVYNRATLFSQLTYSSALSGSSPNDPTNSYYWTVSYTGNGNVKVKWDNGGGGLGNVVETTANSVNIDGLSSGGGDTTVSPTTAIPPAGRFARDTASFSGLPVAVIKSLNTSTPAPYIDFRDSNEASLGKFGVSGGVFVADKDIQVPDEAYGAGWNGSVEVPTKNAIFDAFQSGTYTPTLTGVTNVTSTTSRLATYMRVGNAVTVAGQFDVTPTSNNARTTIGISLPIASDFTTVFQCGGTGTTPVNTSAANVGGIQADATNNRAQFDYYETNGATDTFAYIFTYQIA